MWRRSSCSYVLLLALGSVGATGCLGTSQEGFGVAELTTSAPNNVIDVAAGGELVVSVAVSSTNPVKSVTWQLLDAAGVYENLPNQTGSLLELTDLQPANSGTYRAAATVSNNANTATTQFFSAPIKIVVGGTTSPGTTTCTAAQQKALAAEIANANANSDCTLVVPANPLTAQGLATPYVLKATDPSQGPCREANPNQGAFVEASIFDPATHTISVYHPLVVDEQSTALAAPVLPVLPPNAIVGIWFGSNATFNRLTASDPTTLTSANCIQGLNGDNFGQVSACNAVAFFQAATAAISDGKLKLPALGTASDGKPCPTVRDFAIVDQDQSDNVITSYLADACGNTAQVTATTATLPGTSTIANGSDNKLSTVVDTALGCTFATVTDLTGGPATDSQALDELMANTHQAAPIALVPLGDPMVLTDGEIDNATATTSVEKMNLYRSIVGQPADVSSSTERYCVDLLSVGLVRIAANKKALSAAPSLDPGAANNLYNFLTQRWMGTFAAPDGAGTGLGPVGCVDLLKITNPVTVTTDANGVVTDSVVTLPKTLPAVID